MTKNAKIPGSWIHYQHSVIRSWSFIPIVALKSVQNFSSYLTHRCAFSEFSHLLYSIFLWYLWHDLEPCLGTFAYVDIFILKKCFDGGYVKMIIMNRCRSSTVYLPQQQPGPRSFPKVLCLYINEQTGTLVKSNKANTQRPSALGCSTLVACWTCGPRPEQPPHIPQTHTIVWRYVVGVGFFFFFWQPNNALENTPSSSSTCNFQMGAKWSRVWPELLGSNLHEEAQSADWAVSRHNPVVCDRSQRSSSPALEFIDAGRKIYHFPTTQFQLYSVWLQSPRFSLKSGSGDAECAAQFGAFCHRSLWTKHQKCTNIWTSSTNHGVFLALCCYWL